jgi:NADPH:quinone reductase-like Zn-dependent oxidoreductase
MKSVRFEEFGEPAEVLRLEEQPKPTAGAGELLLRMTARAINPSDLLSIRGLYGQLPALPATPGLEGAGRVEALGEGVTGFQTGQRVIPLGVAGTWQEYLVAPAAQVIPVPDAMPDSVAAQFVVNPLTAWIMLDELNLQPGEWVLQTAAGSTLGRLVIQLAKLRGLKTLNVVRRRAQVEEIKELGGDEVICTDDEDIVTRTYEIAGPNGVRAAIDAVGGDTGGAVAQSLGRNGVMLVYGLLSLENIPLNSGLMIFKGTTVRGFWLTDWFRSAAPDKQAAVFGGAMKAMATGQLIPPVEAEYDLSDVIQAVEHAERPGRSGKVLLIG